MDGGTQPSVPWCRLRGAPKASILRAGNCETWQISWEPRDRASHHRARHRYSLESRVVPMTHQSRRNFLRQSIGITGVGASGYLASSRPLRAGSPAHSDALGANDRIRVGLIGCGGRGRKLLGLFLKEDGVSCAALCDVDDEQTGKALRAVETAGGIAPLQTRDFRQVLDLKDLDAVIVATPDHWHALQSVAACQAGKDIYVEKPLSLTIQEGRTMVRAARLYQRVVQVGTQQRSAPQFAQAVEYVNSGQLGRIRLVRTWAYLDWKGATPKAPDGPPPGGVDYDLWLGPARRQPFNPNRFHFTFRWFWDYSGGLMTDWGAHMVDIAQLGHGGQGPRLGLLGRREIRLSRRCHGNPRYPAGHLGLSPFQHDLGTRTGRGKGAGGTGARGCLSRRRRSSGGGSLRLGSFSRNPETRRQAAHLQGRGVAPAEGRTGLHTRPCAELPRLHALPRDAGSGY
ncbi:MAG: Gfo/Idh/MocA family oxidoreductase [Acidobacteria bacterium]|nr:Gfo/Idh/MocA family oxidoreductase [Acidobacteriota bacterium]